MSKMSRLPSSMLAVLSLLLAIAFAAAAAADIALISPEEKVLPSQEVVFRFNATDAVQNCTLVINGASNKAVPSAQNQVTSVSVELSQGEYNWSAFCNTNTSQINSPTRQFAIDITPPLVRLTAPATFNTSTAAPTYHVEDEHLKNCTLLVDVETQGTLKEVGINHTPASGKNNTFLIELQDRQYKWSVRCADKAGNANSIFFSSSFKVDTTPPSITATQPSSVVTGTSATMMLTTSEDSECRYSSLQQQNYQSMSRLLVTGEKQHQQPLSLQSDGTYAYYVICRDGLGNGNEPKKVEVTVHLLPTAKISLSDAPPLKAGITEVAVQTSKSMGSAPVLTYITAGKEAAIALSGQNDVWKGHFLIEDAPQKTIATFSFKGTDSEGYTGTTITEGKSFVIDTIKPPTPSSLKADEKNRSVALNWYLSGADDISQYRVYRSTSPNPSYLDLHATVNSSQFIDASVQDKVTYYYRIAAVDSAGNIGELSETVYATARTGTGTGAGAGASENATGFPSVPEARLPPLPPQLLLEVNDAAKRVENVKLSAEGAVAAIGSLAGKAREMAELTGVKGQAEAANKRLEQLIAQLESLKKEYKEADELRSALKKITDESNLIERETVTDIGIEGQIEDIPVVKKDQILKALGNTFTEPELGKKGRESYASKNEEELQDLRIKTEAVIAKLTRANGSSEEKSFITHSFSYAGAEAAQDSLIILFIPKTIASSSKELAYPAGKPEVLQDDPVLKWGFLAIGPELQKASYIVSKKISADDVRSIEVVPLLNVNKVGEEGSTPTGLAVLRNIPKAGQFWAVVPGLLVVLALGAYYVLTTPTLPKNQGKDPERTAGNQVPHPILKELDDRLSTIQAEIDEEIYPILASIRNSLMKKGELGMDELITTLIRTAKGYVGTAKSEKAKELYPAIQVLYQSLPADKKAEFSTDCMWLYQQLSETDDQNRQPKPTAETIGRQSVM